MEALLNSDNSNKHDVLREYLKNKENELLAENALEGSGGQDGGANNPGGLVGGMLQSNNQFLKKSNTAIVKVENQRKNKEMMYN